MNKTDKTVVKAALKLSEVNVKDTFTSHIDKTIFLTFLLTPYLYTLSLYEHPSFIIFSAETEYISIRSWYRNKYDFMKYRHRLLYYRVAPIYIRYTLYTTKKKTKLTNAIIVPYSRDRIVAASRPLQIYTESANSIGAVLSCFFVFFVFLFCFVFCLFFF